MASWASKSTSSREESMATNRLSYSKKHGARKQLTASRHAIKVLGGRNPYITGIPQVIPPVVVGNQIR